MCSADELRGITDLGPWIVRGYIIPEPIRTKYSPVKTDVEQTYRFNVLSTTHKVSM